jgi:site-specific DNA recombinase
MTAQTRNQAAIYIRVSSDDQKKGYGPQYQLEETFRVATERDGAIVKPEHVIDDSKSGSSDNRPGWQKVLSLARTGAIDAIYFWKLDRMMRDEYYFYVNEKELRDLGVELRFATQDLKDPFNRAIQVAVAADERRKIRERTYAGRIRAIRDGKWIGIAPYGYKKDKHFRLKVDPSEAEWVKQFFAWLVNEHLSLGKIAMRARERRAPTRYDSKKKKKPRNGPYFWSKGTLKRMLSSEVYTGTAWFRKYLNSHDMLDASMLRPKAEWIEVSVPPLITGAMLQNAREQLAANRANSPRKTKRPYLFAKKLRCAVCKRTLVANGSADRDYKYYRGTYWTDNRCMECRFYSESVLEGAIWPALLSFFKDPETFIPVLEKHRARASEQVRIREEQNTIAVLEERLKRNEETLLGCELEGFYSREVLQNKRRELESQRKILEERKQEVAKMVVAEEQRLVAIASAKALYEKIQKRLDSANYKTKKMAFDLFVEKILLLRSRADVWLRLPREMAVAQAARAFSGNGNGPLGGANFLPHSSSTKNDGGSQPNGRVLSRSLRIVRDTKTISTNELLRSKPYVECDAKTPDLWIPVALSVDLKSSSKVRA